VGVALDLGSLEQSLGRFPVIGVGQVQERATDQLLRRVAEDLLDGGALVADEDVGADHREHSDALCTSARKRCSLSRRAFSPLRVR
jgi:hypothetical protein